jgi:small subunit ribosomal protein S16
MTMMGRRHRPYFRIVATDSRSPRDGKYIEELGTYDPMIPDKDRRVTLRPGRIKYWLGVGALPTEKVGVLLKKYLDKFEKLEAEGGAAPASTEQPA